MRDKGMFGRLLVATGVAASMTVSAGAQFNPIGSGGPLWWFPENDGSYSRHHDRWYVSENESYPDGSLDPWRHATSFPTNLQRDRAWETAVESAPPNSACDYQNGITYPGDARFYRVGPPHDDARVPQVRTPRTPPQGGGWDGGPVAGLQMSLHIGEWWQGMKYRGYFDHATARGMHLDPSYNPLIFGWFDVRIRDGSGAIRRPPLFASEGYKVDFINLGHAEWRLSGGGYLTMPCAGIAMVQAHGVDRGGSGGAFPSVPTGADGGECWASARPMVLRANSEARCEPDLRVRPADYTPAPYTERFYDLFDQALPRIATLGPRTESYLPLEVSLADYAGPHLFARRGEVAVFTASELAQSTAPPVPWSTPAYSGGGAFTGASPSVLEARFAARPDPFRGAAFGAGTVSLPVQDDADPNVRECIEMGEAGWNAATGTLHVDCDHGRANSPLTGRVNSTVMGYGAVERSREAGPVDNSRGFDRSAVARRPGSNPWAPPAGFAWFEHGSATLACLFLEADVNLGLLDEAEEQVLLFEEAAADAETDYLDARAQFFLCVDPFCQAQRLAEMAQARVRWLRTLRAAYTWEIIREYRGIVIPEMQIALGGAFPYGYAGPRSTYRAIGRSLGHGGNACVTGPGGGGYNEALENASPRGSGTYYGAVFVARGAHAAGDQGEPYSQETVATGRTTSYSEAELPPGVEYPEELRRLPDYNNMRRGGSVWREFACGTAHTGYYGGGIERLGPATVNPRDWSGASPDDWWRAPDSEIDLTDPARRFSSGTPCVGDPDYDVTGADGTNRCYDLVPVVGGDPSTDRFTGTVGTYSRARAGRPETGYYRLDYSGDGPLDETRRGTDRIPMRATSYRMLNGSELFELRLRSGFFHMRLGYRSLDVERSSIWSGYGGWSTPFRGSSWLITGESYEGLAPGGCVSGCDSSLAPMDFGRLEHQGPLAWYGAIIPGGTGGCLLAVDRAGVPPGENPQGSVMETPQRILCLLPIDVVPDGRCPGENLP